MKSINPKEMSNECSILELEKQFVNRVVGYVQKMISDGIINPIGDVTLKIPKMKEGQNAVL